MGGELAAISGRVGYAKFEFGDELGRGGMGVVRLAADSTLNRELAIKLQTVASDDDVQQFVEEAQITGQLQHPNIVPIHELGLTDDGRPWMAMKRVEGQTLTTWAEQLGRRTRGRWKRETLHEILDVFAKVGDALAYAHSRRVVHRDLKPDNIMLGAFGEVLVLDWGLARPLGNSNADEPATRGTALIPGGSRATASGRNRNVVSSRRRESTDNLTVQGDVFGTPAFMPPEQATGDVSKIDTRSDIFALGGILYFLLTGAAPYDGPTVFAVINKAAERNLPTPRRRAPQRGIPRELSAIVMKSMAADPRERYRRVEDLQADLQAWREHRTSTAYRPGPVERMVRFTRRKPTVAFGGLLTLIFGAVLGLTISLWALQNEAQQRQAAEQASELERNKRELAEREQQAAEERQRRVELEAREREAQIRNALQQNQLDALRDLLGVKLEATREETIAEFMKDLALRQPTETDESWVARIGRDKIERYISAFTTLLTAAEKNKVPVEPEDYFWRAYLLHVGLAQHGKAFRDYDRAVELQPDNLRFRKARGGCRQTGGRLELAVEDYRFVLEHEPAAVDVRNSMAHTLNALGEVEEAIQQWERVVHDAPRYARGWYDLGNVYLRRNDLPGAMRCFDQAIALGEDAGFLVARASVFQEQQKWQESLVDLDRAIALNNQQWSAHIRRAVGRANIGRFDDALADLDRAKEILEPMRENINHVVGLRTRSLNQIADLRAQIIAARDR